ILLAEPAVAHGDAVASQVFGADARTLGRRDLDALPSGAALYPSPIEKTAPAKGSGYQPDIATADREDGEHGEYRSSSTREASSTRSRRTPEKPRSPA